MFPDIFLQCNYMYESCINYHAFSETKCTCKELDNHYRQDSYLYIPNCNCKICSSQEINQCEGTLLIHNVLSRRISDDGRSYNWAVTIQVDETRHISYKSVHSYQFIFTNMKLVSNAFAYVYLRIWNWQKYLLLLETRYWVGVSQSNTRSSIASKNLFPLQCHSLSPTEPWSALVCPGKWDILPGDLVAHLCCNLWPPVWAACELQY